MRISIDATGLAGVKTGTAVYLTEILRCWNSDVHVVHEFVIFASPKALPYLQELGLDERFRFVRAPDATPIRVLWQQLVLPRLLKELRVDVHWGAGFVLPLLCRTRMVVTIYDLTFQLFPAVHELFKRFYFPAMMAAAVRKAKRVLVISESTERDLHAWLPVSQGKTVVTLLAPRAFEHEDVPLDIRLATGDCYFLSLGTLEPRKNVERLLEAWLGIDEHQRLGAKLVFVGLRGWMVDELLKRHADADASVVFAGYLGDASLNRLLRDAQALLYPSLYEGFGLPVLEAMAQGIPVLTSDIGATREVAADAALLVDPTDVSDIRAGVVRLLNDAPFRRELSKRGLLRASQFSWGATASKTLQALEMAHGDK